MSKKLTKLSLIETNQFRKTRIFSPLRDIFALYPFLCLQTIEHQQRHAELKLFLAIR